MNNREIDTPRTKLLVCSLDLRGTSQKMEAVSPVSDWVKEQMLRIPCDLSWNFFQ